MRTQTVIEKGQKALPERAIGLLRAGYQMWARRLVGLFAEAGGVARSDAPQELDVKEIQPADAADQDQGQSRDTGTQAQGICEKFLEPIHIAAAFGRHQRAKDCPEVARRV
ncbi:hypothetical protein SAMN05216241_10382 [Limimonas halophila]|uniref:Uncharacterized protein n=1 Tax=Limimonas halophila TaxID=1082479 RepID=A0A1G7PV10_9PROT|nr:hypothetical protein SAMN05216241_10382 [Limimonas halophila]